MKLRRSSVAPTPLSELRSRTLPLPEQSEFSLRQWLNSAKQSLDLANKKWTECKMTEGEVDGRKVEETYSEFKKAAT